MSVDIAQDGSKQLTRWPRVVLRVFLAVVVLYAAGLVVAWFAQETFIFPRWLIPEDRWSGPAPPAVEPLHVASADGSVPAWFFPGEAGAGLIVYLHGNGRVIDDCVGVCRWLQASGWHVLLPEYRGYGRAPGSPSQSTISADITAFVKQVRSMEGVNKPLVLYGRSIGSCFAATLAKALHADALILQTPPAGIRQMAARYGVPGFVIHNPLDSVSALGAMGPVPTLVIEHAQDTLVPASHAKAVLKASDGEHCLVDGTHNECDDAAVERAVETFLKGR